MARKESINNDVKMSFGYIKAHSYDTEFMKIASAEHKWTEEEINNPVVNKAIHWDILLATQDVSLELACNHEDKFSWKEFSKYDNLPNDKIVRYACRLDWDTIAKYQKLDEETLEACFRYLDLPAICKYQELPISFLENHWGVLKRTCMDEICQYQKLTNDFMKQYKHDLDWSRISEYQKLSVSFMEDMKEYIDWTWVSLKQNFTDRFIVKFKNRLNMKALISRGIEIPKSIKDRSDISCAICIVDDLWKGGVPYYAK